MQAAAPCGVPSQDESLVAEPRETIQLFVSGKIWGVPPQTSCSTTKAIRAELSYRIVIDQIDFAVSFDIDHPVGAEEVAMHEFDRSSSNSLISYRVLEPIGFLLLITSLDGRFTDFQSKGMEND